MADYNKVVKLMGVTGTDGADLALMMMAYDKASGSAAKKVLLNAMNDIAKKNIKNYKAEQLLKALKDSGIA